MSIVSIKNVTKRYASHTALSEINLEVPVGSVFGLLGPNGAGKTSLIRIINQITAPDEGEVFFNGHPLKEHHINEIGYLPEERGLYKKMEVGEQAIYLAQLKGLSRSEAVSRLKVWFERFEIKSWWKKKVEELSKGMAQKVQFIVTVVHEPKLLILDEPFSGFDPINANLVRDELLRLRDEGTTIILSTHRMESVEELCSHIALINLSKKILDGPVKEIKRTYRSNTYELEYTGNTISLANSLWGDFELLENVKDEEIYRAKIKLGGNATTNDLLKSLIGNVSIHGFKELIPGMNDIFIQLVSSKQEVVQ
jgi:ABC-2 type transport system ATP-binding protein